MTDTTQPGIEPDEEVVPLENAALLTQGGSSSSVENKRSPYDC
ncbi:albusnodin family lasso peptide [Streptomyces sp. NPDC094448]